MLSVESSETLGPLSHGLGQTKCEVRADVGGSEPAGHSPIERLYKIGHREALLSPSLHGSLPALICGVGFQEKTKPSYVCDGLRGGHEEFAIIHYTLSGRGRLRYHDREMFVEPGQAMLLHRPHDHRYWIEEGERWEFFYLTLGGAGAVRGMREIVDKLGPIIALDESSPALARAADACAMALEGRIGSTYRSSELAYAIVMELLKVSAEDAQRARPLLRAVPAFVLDVEKFCQLNLARPIGVDDMARVAKMSRFHFSRQFGKARGISPGRYLASLRLDEAKRLITGSGFTVKKVAEHCGFGDANYFRKIFRRSFGVSPGAYRTGRA